MTREEHKALVINLVTKSEEEINAMCDCGVFNNIIKGYAIIAMKQVGVTKEQIKNVDFYHIFDEINAYEARWKDGEK